VVLRGARRPAWFSWLGRGTKFTRGNPERVGWELRTTSQVASRTPLPVELLWTLVTLLFMASDPENWADAYVKRARSAPRVNSIDASRLAGLAQSGNEEALADLLQAHGRLVVRTASKYHGRMELGDALRLGDEGLKRAAQRFNASKGIPFSSYATWWIRQAIVRGFKADGAP